MLEALKGTASFERLLLGKELVFDLKEDVSTDCRFKWCGEFSLDGRELEPEYVVVKLLAWLGLVLLAVPEKSNSYSSNLTSKIMLGN